VSDTDRHAELRPTLEPKATATPSATATSTASPTPGPVEATFVYDGDGNRVLGTVNGITTAYVGNHYEVEGATVRKYYRGASPERSGGGTAVGQRVAMREDGVLYWLLTDHLGSTSVTIDEGGAKVGEERYKAFGETRYAAGDMSTTFGYTGQREEPGIGLYYYRARCYEPKIGLWIQPGPMVLEPAHPLGWDRHGYVRDNPVRRVDRVDTVRMPA